MTELEPIYELPFTPTYDPVIPINIDEDERGVLCVCFYPGVSVKTIRVEANLVKIMEAVGIKTYYSYFLKFYKLGNKMIIMQNENKSIWRNVLKYKDETFDVQCSALICNEGFTSLTQTEALKILNSAHLTVQANGDMVIDITIEE